jgi:glucokinase
VTPVGEVVARAEVPSPAEDPEALVAAIAGIAGGLANEAVAAIGIGAAGMVDQAGTVRFAPNLAWRDLPLGERIRDAVGLPVLVGNDANMAAWGEFRVGAGRAVEHMILVTLGTGIGGGVVIDGELLRGAHGFAAEIGHVIVEPDGPPCGCGNRGCWEQVASGTAITRAARAAVREHPRSALAQLVAGDPDAVTGADVTEIARGGDPLSRSILAVVGRRLGEGLAGLANTFDPELIVIGGGVAAAGDLLLAPARAAFRDAIEAPEHRPAIPPIVPAMLGNDAGSVGAAFRAFEEVETRR